MNQLRKLQNLFRDTRGLSTVEYVVILVLIVAIAVGTWNVFGKNVFDALDKSNSTFKTNVTDTADAI